MDSAIHPFLFISDGQKNAPDYNENLRQTQPLLLRFLLA
jgi:hypothetical protein